MPQGIRAKTGIDDEILSKLREGQYHPAVTIQLKKAYTQTQYAKLRRSGVGREEAWSLARTATPQEVSRVASNRRAYIEEMVWRKGFKSTRAYQRAKKSIRKQVRQKDYTDSDWARFSEWYSMSRQAKAALYPAWRALAPTVGRTPEQFPFEHQAQMLQEPYRPQRVMVDPMTGEPMEVGPLVPPKRRRVPKAKRLEKRLKAGRERERKLRQQVRKLREAAKGQPRDSKGRFVKRRTRKARG